MAEPVYIGAKIAQWACRRNDDQPWVHGSAFWLLHEELEGWYNGLDLRHKWSKQNLRGMFAEGKDIVSVRRERSRLPLTRNKALPVPYNVLQAGERRAQAQVSGEYGCYS